MQVTIVGGGFGGVKTALELAKNQNNQITLITASKQFQFYPTLYATAAGVNHKESWIPYGQLFADAKNVTVIYDTITSLDAAAKKLTGQAGEYTYETLVLALGSVTTYFGIKGLDQFAMGIKSEKEIRELHDHIFYDMRDGTEDEKNYVIIGAGPTGVELAGMLGEYLKRLRKHFGLKSTPKKITLIEAAPRVLPRSSEKGSAQVAKRLQKLGVTIKTNMKVEEATVNSLTVNGKPLETQTIIWTSGVANAPFYKDNADQFTLNERGKVVVDEHLRARDDVYVIGDNAATPFAGLAQTALHDAIFLARHLQGSKQKYKPYLPPSVIPVGHGWALFEWHKLRFGGLLGDMMHRAANLVGFRDLLPTANAIKLWRATGKKELRIPDKIE